MPLEDHHDCICVPHKYYIYILYVCIVLSESMAMGQSDAQDQRSTSLRAVPCSLALEATVTILTHGLNQISTNQ